MFSFRRNKDFHKVSTDEDCESLMQGSQDLEDHIRSQPSSRPWNLLLLLILVPCSFLVGARFGGNLFIDQDGLSIHHVSKYSPLLEEVDVTFSTVQFNGTLLHENIYRQTASPAVDEAWQALGVDYRSAVVPPHLAAKSGLLPSQVQVSEKYGGGFPANVEGLHHLHCLNLLRQSLYFNFDYYRERKEGAFINSDDILRHHVTHCLDILRQQLMCTVDIGVLGQVWWNREAPAAYPDFDTKHTCRNFEAVRDWAFRHQAPPVEETPDDYLRAPGVWDVLEALP